MNVILGSRRRDLSSWRDYWLSEARLRASDAAKVLAMDLVVSASSISFRDRFGSREKATLHHCRAIDDWCQRQVLAWRADAVADLASILGSDVTGEVNDFRPDSSTAYLHHVALGASTSPQIMLEMTGFAIFGNADGKGAVTPPCILADWDNFILHCHNRSLQEDVVQHEYSIRNS